MKPPRAASKLIPWEAFSAAPRVPHDPDVRVAVYTIETSVGAGERVEPPEVVPLMSVIVKMRLLPMFFQTPLSAPEPEIDQSPDPFDSVKVQSPKSASLAAESRVPENWKSTVQGWEANALPAYTPSAIGPVPCRPVSPATAEEPTASEARATTDET